MTCQLWADGKESTLPVRTAWKEFKGSYTSVPSPQPVQCSWILTDDSWSQPIVLPITYPSLSFSSQLAFTIWDVQGPGKAVPVGGTTMRLFRDDR